MINVDARFASTATGTSTGLDLRSIITPAAIIRAVEPLFHAYAVEAIMDAIYHLLRKQRHVESHQLLSYVPSDTLGELNTGSWWKETQDALCLQSHMHLLPIILFSDGTLLDNAGVINGDIIAIRLGNLPLEMYVKTDNCQVLGLMPSDPCATKAQKAARKRLGITR